MRAVLFLLSLTGLLLGCSEGKSDADRASSSHPWIVVGIDGGEWSVIHELWDEGRLPNLRSVAERGTTSVLRTDFAASPIIWTTIATGVGPAEHGITGFVVPTEGGDVPVTSTMRRAPALWNMLSRAHRRVAVLGWWATWPAEDVSGIVVSDRAFFAVSDTVSPESFADRFAAVRREAQGEENAFGGGNLQTRERDHSIAYLARQLATERYDLLLSYFRGVDIASHNSWRCFRPEDFRETDPPAIEGCSDRIPREYEAVDRALGGILAVAADANVLVISDHGFRPLKPEIIKVLLDLDVVLERLGFLARQADGMVDLEGSAVYTYDSPVYKTVKQVRFGGAASDQVRGELEDALARVEFLGEDGPNPAFFVRDTRKGELGDAVVRVQVEWATPTLLLDGDPGPLAGIASPGRRISGTHGARTHGILLAAGPDVEPGADLDGISIYDIAPTLLYGLGLPVAENFVGSPRLELFTERYRRRHPVRTIAAWALPRDGDVVTSEADEEIVRELGALGYLD